MLRFVAKLLVFSLLFQVALPLANCLGAEESQKAEKYSYLGSMIERLDRDIIPDERHYTPDEVQSLIDSSVNETFEGNPTLRVEESNIIRPIKQVGLKVLDSEIGIVQSFLSYQAANFLKKSFTDHKARYQMEKAKQVVGLLAKNQSKSLVSALHKANVVSKMNQMLGSATPRVRNFIKSEANFALMSVIGAMIWMGIYDGLDAYALKDKVLALDPLTTNNTWSHALFPNFLGSVASRNLYSFFNDKFDDFYKLLLNSRGFGSHLLKVMDSKADLLGKKLFKATRMGLKTGGKGSLAAKLGLVGIGEGTQFTLQGFLKSFSAGVAFGMVANLVVDTVIVGSRGYVNSSIVGANRDKKIARPEYNGYLFQRTESKVKNWLRERKFALMDLYAAYSKDPLKRVVSTVSGFTGAYFGSVVAGALIVGGGIPAMVGGVMIASVFGGIGAFLGEWLTTKFERGDAVKNLRRSFVERKLYKIIKKMKIYLDGEIDKEEARKLANDRSWDMHDLEAMGQAYVKMLFVESFDKILLYFNDGIQFMKSEEHYGQEFDLEAHMRYDIIDRHGHRGLWDFGTGNIFDVGKISENNCFSVIFITDNDRIKVENGLLHSEKGTDFRVLSNGVIMARSELKQGDWAIRGINVNTDVFLRNRKERYAWDYDLQAYRRVRYGAGTNISLLAFTRFLNQEPEEFKKSILHLAEKLGKRSHDQSIKLVESIQDDNESEFFEVLNHMQRGDEAVQWFESMERSQWKNILLGRMKRSIHHKMDFALSKLKESDAGKLAKALSLELQNPASKTQWDALQSILNQNQHILEHTH